MQEAIKLFAIKAAITGAVAAAVFWFVLVAIDDIVGERINRVDQMVSARLDRAQAMARTIIAESSGVGGRKFWLRIEHAIEDLADPKNDLSPEKKEKLLKEIDTISNRWRPFLQRGIGNVAAPSKEN